MVNIILNYFKNSANNLVLFWYQGVMKELHDIPCSTFKIFREGL